MAISVDSRVAGKTIPKLEILVGTYEEFVLGFKLKENTEGGLILVQSFTNHSHCGSLRSVATSKRFLASGSTDESIRLFSLRDRTEHGYLQQHCGTITCLEFHQQSYMFSGSDDGNVCVWNTRTWKCEKTLKAAHVGGVTAISIHPSGKLALTVGKDRAMKTWNLIKGRTAYVTNIKAVADAVKWSPDGTHYVVAMNNIANIYEVKSAGIKMSIDFKNSINVLIFLNDDTLAIGGEGPNVESHSISERKLLTQFKAHEKRVKDAAVINFEEEIHLVTVSNDKFIKLWKFEEIGREPSLVTEVDSGCRITCMALWTGSTENDSEGPDVKPITVADSPTKAKAVASVKPNQNNNTRPLKSLLKRASTEAIVVVKSSSGPFIAERVKERSEKRPRLTFNNLPV